ncbi:hypothetical protein [Bacillus pinisoli]|uniref:hypothetical protein n=1 Tax=Bacillus pinisoli TaxID=2901866 RepID=UPI001FF33E69|nr:hypothetical protein [Bacillus pinisoli]
MKHLSIGSVFGLLLLLSFMLLRNWAGLWVAFCLSLLIFATVFIFYIKNKKLKTKDILQISIASGFIYMIIASLGIMMFPPEQIRDAGDIVMPYLHVFIFGFITSVSFLLVGFSGRIIQIKH